MIIVPEKKICNLKKLRSRLRKFKLKFALQSYSNSLKEHLPTAAGPVTVAGRLAEAPPTAYLNQTSPEPA